MARKSFRARSRAEQKAAFRRMGAIRIGRRTFVPRTAEERAQIQIIPADLKKLSEKANMFSKGLPKDSPFTETAKSITTNIEKAKELQLRKRELELSGKRIETAEERLRVQRSAATSRKYQQQLEATKKRIKQEAEAQRIQSEKLTARIEESRLNMIAKLNKLEAESKIPTLPEDRQQEIQDNINVLKKSPYYSEGK